MHRGCRRSAAPHTLATTLHDATLRRQAPRRCFFCYAAIFRAMLLLRYASARCRCCFATPCAAIASCRFDAAYARAYSADDLIARCLLCLWRRYRHVCRTSSRRRCFMLPASLLRHICCHDADTIFAVAASFFFSRHAATPATPLPRVSPPLQTYAANKALYALICHAATYRCHMLDIAAACCRYYAITRYCR